MARFVFKLAVVLKQKADAEQTAQRVVALARRQLVPLQEQLADLDRQRREADDTLRTRLVGPIDVPFIAGHRRFVVAMEKSAMEVVRKIAEAQIAVDKAQTALLAAARERKTIETLRDRQLERWTEEQTRREAADLDEAGMQIAYANLTAEQNAADAEAAGETP